MKKFPVFDPITLDVKDTVERKKVHSIGHWHRGVQAHLVKKTKKGFSIFIQRRSKHVDINKYKLDQSLATQMIQEDEVNLYRTLQRGLKEELNITEYNAKMLPFNFRIIKRYANDPSVVNKEILSLFLVESLQEPNYSHCKKISEGYWLPWDDFLRLFFKNTQEFTKTSSMYFQHPDILEYIEKATIDFLSNKQLPTFRHTKKIIFGYFPAIGKHQYHLVENTKALHKLITMYT